MNVSQAKNNGETPIFVAAGGGFSTTIRLLAGLLRDMEANMNRPNNTRLDYMNRPNNTGQTPLSNAMYHQEKKAVSVLRGLGAKLLTDHMDIETVDDVVTFFKTLGISPVLKNDDKGKEDSIATFEKNLREGEIDAAKLFAISEAAEILKNEIDALRKIEKVDDVLTFFKILSFSLVQGTITKRKRGSIAEGNLRKEEVDAAKLFAISEAAEILKDEIDALRKVEGRRCCELLLKILGISLKNDDKGGRAVSPLLRKVRKEKRPIRRSSLLYQRLLKFTSRRWTRLGKDLLKQGRRFGLSR